MENKDRHPPPSITSFGEKMEVDELIAELTSQFPGKNDDIKANIIKYILKCYNIDADKFIEIIKQAKFPSLSDHEDGLILFFLPELAKQESEDRAKNFNLSLQKIFDDPELGLKCRKIGFLRKLNLLIYQDSPKLSETLVEEAFKRKWIDDEANILPDGIIKKIPIFFLLLLLLLLLLQN